MTPISTYIGQFFAGGVDPWMPHLILVLAAVIGGLAVGVGIIWEAARGGHLRTLPTLIVSIGVVAEAAATVILFVFDEGISRAQQAKIESAQIELFIADAKLRPRVLSIDEQKDIENGVRGISAKVFIVSPTGNAFASSIILPLMKAHVIPIPVTSRPGDMPAFPIRLSCPGDAVTCNHDPLYLALKKAGLWVAITSDRRIPNPAEEPVLINALPGTYILWIASGQTAWDDQREITKELLSTFGKGR